MRPCDEQSEAPLSVLEAWYKTQVGRQVLAAEQACVADLLEDSFGHFIVQLGCAGAFDQALANSRIRTHVVLSESECRRRQGSPLRALPFELPIDTSGVDAVLLPHTLEFCSQPQGVLREVERVLIPEGRVLVLAFNPLSGWGLARALVRRRRVPWCGAQLTPLRVADWLGVLGLQIEVRQGLVFRPPLRGAYWRRLDWLEPLGARWWPMFGGVYAIRAVKRVSVMTPLRPRAKPQPAILPGRAVKPTARAGHHA
jgi:SAM-dependent methyltransferase